ncbi:MAG: glycosyltransferase family 8 protein [Clostridia bacterium]|nr:glycosyltransferase family 8 protein [Clostridia bacterium]
MKKTVPIFFSCDDNYVPCLAVAIRSIIENANKDYIYKIHVLNTSISDECRERILALAEDGIDITFTNVSGRVERLGKKLHLRDYYTASIYFRIFIPEMFPEYDKAIYLDSDVVVNADIANLFNFDVEDYLVGAVEDQIVTATPEFVDYVDRAVGVKVPYYFNSGVLLMNLRAMRECRLEKTFIDLMNEYHFDTVAPDQDYLNALCKGRVLYLDIGWNKMSFNKDYDGTPSVVHYNMFLKPWHAEGICYEEYFWYYARSTDFYGELLEFRRVFGKDAIEKKRAGADNLLKSAKELTDSEVCFRTVLFADEREGAVIG